jgi:hypothetical protein
LLDLLQVPTSISPSNPEFFSGFVIPASVIGCRMDYHDSGEAAALP